MMSWLKRRCGGIFVLCCVALLGAAGLGWATRAALRVEQDRLTQAAEADFDKRVRLALWRLDGRVGNSLAREDSRPFNHFTAVFAPTMALDGSGMIWAPGSVVEPSPLLNAELPSWMLLHFQTDSRGWESPQVLSPALRTWLTKPGLQGWLTNVTDARRDLLASLAKEMPAEKLLVRAQQYTNAAAVTDRALLALSPDNPTWAFGAQQGYGNVANSVNPDAKENYAFREYYGRAGGGSKLAQNLKGAEERVAKDVALFNSCRNGEEWLEMNRLQGGSRAATPRYVQSQTYTPGLSNRGNDLYAQLPRIPPSSEVAVQRFPMVGTWLPVGGRERLVALRMVRAEKKEVVQGIVLDDVELRSLLAEEVRDLFPDATVEPAREPSEEELALTMTTLPMRLVPNETAAPADPGWTGLRVGLVLAWVAAAVALCAVGLVGSSLIDLSERRMRFVSAVTHELRTPLTTLRLYLDMLLGGLVRDESRKTEYLQTLDAETDRLTRLVGNVLDYSRLENQGPRVRAMPVRAADVLAAAEAAWRPRCELAGKELIVEPCCDESAELTTDADLLGQVLGNLLDNAIKYSRDSDDRRLWLRCRVEGKKVAFEVEDRGPGVEPAERGRIFRPFQRGHGNAATTGGVGLGLALALRWAAALGGKLSLRSPAEGGACFRVEV